MFKELGAMMNMLGNKSKLQEEMARFNTAISQIVVEGSSGAGDVIVKVSGRMEIMSVRISDECYKGNDKEMLEDLVTAAVNAAMQKAREAVASETAKMAESMGLPAGMLGGGFPGLS